MKLLPILFFLLPSCASTTTGLTLSGYTFGFRTSSNPFEASAGVYQQPLPAKPFPTEPPYHPYK